MSLQVRRVVTGHDRDGRAVVAIDEIAQNIVRKRAGYASCVVWATENFPADNTDATDGASRDVPTSVPNGTVFRVVRYEPGVAPRIHRTDSLDYGVVISGEIDMELDGGEVHLRAGDVIVQRGTVHNWINRGTEPCVVAFVLTSAEPLAIGENKLEAFG
ncbi:MAG: cupin domain-containing protein [Xanthobacteraceae bacterium]